MKKWLALFLTLCLVFSIVACDIAETKGTTETSTTTQKEIVLGGICRFTGEIKKITDTYLEVYTEDENMRCTSDLFHVSIPDGSDVNGFAVGDTVEIVYAGAIEELYPARITGTVSIELWHCGLTEELSLDAKVIDIDKDSMNVTVRNIENEEIVQVHVVDVDALDIAVGDSVQISYDSMEEENALKKIQNPLSIRFRQRYTSDIQFEARVLEIADDFVRVLGTTEGYEREFVAMVDNGDELMLGETVTVSCLFRGEYVENNPVVMERVSVHSMTPKTFYFNARIIETYDKMFLVAGEHVGLCRLTFDLEVSLEGYQVGEYINVAYNGSVNESFPSQAYGYDIRYMTEEEIAEFYQETTLQGIYKGVSDGMVLIYAEEENYFFAVDALDDLPTMTEGDSIEVVYDRFTTFSADGIKICFPVSVNVVEE